MLGLTRTYAPCRVYEMKPFYLPQKVKVIGAVSLKKVVWLMIINNLINFSIYRLYFQFKT